MLYRGTKKDLQAELPAAAEEMRNLIKKLCADQSDEFKAVLESHFFSDDYKDWDKFKVAIKRSGSMYYSSRNSEYDDYFYEFTCGASLRSQWGRNNIRMRKNGTFNEENIRDGVVLWVNRILSHQRSKAERDDNQQYYESIGSPSHPNCTIALKGKRQAQIDYRATDEYGKIHLQRTVPIDQIKLLIKRMVNTHDYFSGKSVTAMIDDVFQPDPEHDEMLKL